MLFLISVTLRFFLRFKMTGSFFKDFLTNGESLFHAKCTFLLIAKVYFTLNELKQVIRES